MELTCCCKGSSTHALRSSWADEFADRAATGSSPSSDPGAFSLADCRGAPLVSCIPVHNQ